MSEMKAIGWITDDHDSDRSATTYDPKMADRWRQKGWPVTPIFTIPADQVLVPREWLSALIGEISHGFGSSFEESEIAEQIRAILNP